MSALSARKLTKILDGDQLAFIETRSNGSLIDELLDEVFLHEQQKIHNACPDVPAMSAVMKVEEEEEDAVQLARAYGRQRNHQLRLPGNALHLLVGFDDPLDTSKGKMRGSRCSFRRTALSGG